MYYPQLHVDTEVEWIQIRKQLLKLLSSEELAKRLSSLGPSTEEFLKQLGSNQVGNLTVPEQAAGDNKKSPLSS